MNPRHVLALLLFALAAGGACAQNAPPAGDPKATEQWEPVPPVVTPGQRDAAPPSDAIVLFDGHNLEQWEASKDQSPAHWKVHDGVATVDKTTGNIQTRRRFKNYQLHLEWQVPKNISGEGQARGNSGVFAASTGPGDEGYEIQILDSYRNKTYVNGQAAAIYKQTPPLANAMRPPGEWQAYDIVWTAPVFAADGSLQSPAYVTVLHNGVVVQNHSKLTGETLYIGKPVYKAYTDAPIKLQAHGDPSAPISFRNIWVRPLD
ncbi:3-keto-disaccharide hydrolase [Dyella sp. 2RAB6]|uniref:3-keto-disaccharide hydrolase n=1 Tax=Dyella sp. 2RAB6 TaxID=3232992 RepID=UPI003F931A3A